MIHKNSWYRHNDGVKKQLFYTVSKVSEMPNYPMDNANPTDWLCLVGPTYITCVSDEFLHHCEHLPSCRTWDGLGEPDKVWRPATQLDVNSALNSGGAYPAIRYLSHSYVGDGGYRNGQLMAVFEGSEDKFYIRTPNGNAIRAHVCEIQRYRGL